MKGREFPSNAELSADGRTLTVTIPFSVQKRGGRKVIVTPEGAAPWAPTAPRIDNTLIRALARAHRWKRMLERGDYATIRDIERAEGVTNSFVSRVLKLTLLAPDIIEAILDGQQSKTLLLECIAYGFSVRWIDQRNLIASTAR